MPTKFLSTAAKKEGRVWRNPRLRFCPLAAKLKASLQPEDMQQRKISMEESHVLFCISRIWTSFIKIAGV